MIPDDLAEEMIKSDLKARQALRNSEERRLTRAVHTIYDLSNKHFPSELAERWNADLFMLEKQLQQLIRNQHIRNEKYKEHKNSGVVPSGDDY